MRQIIEAQVLRRETVALPPAPVEGGWIALLVFGPGVAVGLGMFALVLLVLVGGLR